MGNTDLRGYDIKSYITGFTLGTSYEHMYAHLYFEGIDNLIVKGGGILKYDVLIEDIGTYYTESLSFQANVNDPDQEFIISGNF